MLQCLPRSYRDSHRVEAWTQIGSTSVRGKDEQAYPIADGERCSPQREVPLVGNWDFGDEFRADQHMDMSLMESFIIVHRGALFQAGNLVRILQYVV